MGLAYCAAVTERVRLASGILNAFVSSPFEIAMTAMDLDRVSGGRLVLGLGTSIRAWSEGLHGMKGYSRPKDIHWNAWLWVAVNPDRAEARNDARATVAFYAGMRQYEPMFAAMGFGKQARACCEAFERKDMTGWVGAVSDEMAETFVVLGTADDCRRRVAEIWDLADSFCLVPPIGGLPPDKLTFYAGGIVETFYS